MANAYKTLELLPAYGRTYSTEAEALADWTMGKDFCIWRGPYCSVRDVAFMKQNGYTHIHLMWEMGRNSITFRI